jgi:CRP/FNR family transcriptional regulator
MQGLFALGKFVKQHFHIFTTSMKTPFPEYLSAQTQLSETEIASIVSLAKARQLRRGEQLLAAGEVSRFKIFVQSGLLRAYTLSADGHETIFHFLQEEAWTSLDVESYELQSPSSFHIAAIEPAELLVWNKRDFDRLLFELPGLKNYADRMGAQKVYSNKQRLMTALTGSPEEKYERFKRDLPGLHLKLPLHMIAAYLGISVKTLTRIRHAQLVR